LKWIRPLSQLDDFRRTVPLTLVGLVHLPVHVIVTLGSAFNDPVKVNEPAFTGIAFATCALYLLHLKFD
jgi:hypothetical protein